MVSGVVTAVKSPILIRMNAEGPMPTPGLATRIVVLVPGSPEVGLIDKITGTSGMYVNIGPLAESPLSTFVTTMAALGGVQGIGVRPVMAMISVPLTLMGCATTPAMLTAIGSLNPTPSIDTRVPPNAEPPVGAAAVICILAM